MKGNQLLAALNGSSLAPAILEHRWDAVIKEYLWAVNTAQTNDDSLSAHKNLAVAYSKKLDFFMQNPKRCQDLKNTYRNLTGAIISTWSKCLGASVLSSNHNKPDSWFNDIYSKLKQMVDDIFENRIPDSDDFPSNVQLAWTACEQTDNDIPLLKCWNFVQNALFLYKQGVKRLNDNCYKDALNCFSEAKMPLEEGNRFHKRATGLPGFPAFLDKDECSAFTKELKSELVVLGDDLDLHTAIANAQKSLELGDEALDRAMNYQDDCNFDQIYFAYDFFQDAIIQSKEKDVLTEAIACSRLGRIQKTVFATKSRAKDYFRRAMNLGLSLQPKDVSKELWYKEASDAIQQFQKETVKSEEAKLAEERAKYADEIKDDLAEIETLRSYEEFLTWVYNEYPPRRPYVQDPTHSLKKKYQMALFHYHPDKQTEDEGRKWFFICEAIAKRLTRVYNAMKEAE